MEGTVAACGVRYSSVCSAAFSPASVARGRFVAAGDGGGGVTLFEAALGAEVEVEGDGVDEPSASPCVRSFRAHRGACAALAWVAVGGAGAVDRGRSGTLLSGGADGRLRSWVVEEEVLEVETPGAGGEVRASMEVDICALTDRGRHWPSQASAGITAMAVDEQGGKCYLATSSTR